MTLWAIQIGFWRAAASYMLLFRFALEEHKTKQ
jgi:hypothetical protein